MDRIEKARPILDLIGKNESDGAARAQGVPNGYFVVWSGIKPADRPKNITAMTIDRVLKWQDSIDSKYMSEAAGRYQIMEDTLRGLNFNPNDLFDKATQDGLALQLLDRRGWARCEAGQISPNAFGNYLAMEWASFPVITGPKRGRSHYAGDGLNKSHTTPETVLEAIQAALDRHDDIPGAVNPDPVQDDTPGREDAILAWLQAAPPGVRPAAEWLMQMPEEMIHELG